MAATVWRWQRRDVVRHHGSELDDLVQARHHRLPLLLVLVGSGCEDVVVLNGMKIPDMPDHSTRLMLPC
jgi:hypothetical protein